MRLRVRITGLVQGVGFRPFVFRLAERLGLAGFVMNDTVGVFIEAEGEEEKLVQFLQDLQGEKPPLAKIYGLQHMYLPDATFSSFEIRKSQKEDEKRPFVLPDITVCDDCLKDITSPRNRRFLYPFTNCTNCGPRFTIIHSLPYDRTSTSMKDFNLCPDCLGEYHRPSDRRFHAQPNACHSCGPWLTLYNHEGQVIAERDGALEQTTNLIRKGSIIAVKGLGGYHLICDATNDDVVRTLRQRKHREEKPMAVMFPDIASLKEEALVSPLEERSILSVERPIVIVMKSQNSGIAPSVSPDNATLGVFLPYTPLHFLILKKLKKPIVATSANITDEPIMKDEADAFARLAGVADYFLTHNRHIVRRCDDSVVRLFSDRQVLIRRSRGYSPVPVAVPFALEKPVLALGPFMNSAIALGINSEVFVSQHIGDLDNPLTTDVFDETIQDFLKLFNLEPEIVVADMHPGYYSTRYGEKHYQDRLVKVQHHFAHILSCMAENDLPEDAQVIGFAFDGTGYGMDGSIWGGEVLITDYHSFERAYHLRPYPLPGGDKAVLEPRRTALSLLHETFGDDIINMDVTPFSHEERAFFLDMIGKNVNSPSTSSMGRLFDGIASILGVRHTVSYHAQAAIALEQLALRSQEKSSYPFGIEDRLIDERPIIEMIVQDLKSGVSPEVMARKFHNTVVKIVLLTAEILRKETGITSVVLSGGVFQNLLITENILATLKDRGFTPLIHQLLPPNDGGMSLGQAVYSHFI